MTFLFSEAVRVETKVGRMHDWKGQQRHLLPSLTGLKPLRPVWAQESLGVGHFDYSPFKLMQNEFLFLSGWNGGPQR